METSYICNDVCETDDCEDEASCNGFTYGMYCEYPPLPFSFSTHPTRYVPPTKICNRLRQCAGREDEEQCSEDYSFTTCRTGQTFLEIVKPVHNFTRCAVLNLGPLKEPEEFYDGNKYCRDEDLRKYQTNCSDPERVGGRCRVDGYLSTFSKYVLCYRDVDVKICDDDIDKQCIEISKSCTVHKHRMCDGIVDCFDKSDESHYICRHMTYKVCNRRVGKPGKTELTLPIAWLNDGIEDCLDGIDELPDWPTCGEDKTRRFVVSNTTCQGVFLCLSGNPGYVELEDLCDGIDTCGNENEICSTSRRSQLLSITVSRGENSLVKHISFCLKGLKSIENLGGNNCTQEFFMFPDHDYFGVDNKTEILLPENKQDCHHMYGEQYVFSSCTGKCLNSSCPLQEYPTYTVCPDQYPDRVGTVANNKYLAFFTKSQGYTYTNSYFVCDDRTKCIDYKQVCDLVDDCNDFSDEIRCTNHFRCNTSKHLIPKTKKCDGRFDCLDMSDECNEECSNQILAGPLKILSWLIGLSAIISNCVIVIKSLSSLGRSKNTVVLINKSLVILIAVGDFLVGFYLCSIAGYDEIVYKKNYCSEQINWITSYQCASFGVISTIGSQISLFSITVLSFIRLCIIWNSKKVPSKATKTTPIKILAGVLLLVMLSAVIAVVPIIDKLEDFFVNGVVYSEKLKLFIGTPNKQEITDVLEAYYGKMKHTTLSWRRIHKMVFEMFSSDYDQFEIFRNTKLVHFYGNDGVCLFKYFVDKDDPQKLFVWAILGLNFLCFTFVSASYLKIVLISRRSGKNAGSSASGGKRGSKRVNEMNRRIAFIIATDFVCWIPFICICVLHSLELIDATPWYSLFSMMILPINSVINPLIYDDAIARIPRVSVRVFQNNVRKLVIVQNLRTRAQQRRPMSETFENSKTHAPTPSIKSENIMMKDMAPRNAQSTCEKKGGLSRNTDYKEEITSC